MSKRPPFPDFGVAGVSSSGMLGPFAPRSRGLRVRVAA